MAPIVRRNDRLRECRFGDTSFVVSWCKWVRYGTADWSSVGNETWNFVMTHHKMDGVEAGQAAAGDQVP